MHWRSGHKPACQQLSVSSGLFDGSPQKEGVDSAGLQKGIVGSILCLFRLKLQIMTIFQHIHPFDE